MLQKVSAHLLRCGSSTLPISRSNAYSGHATGLSALGSLFRVHPLVSEALAEHQPVVALETTIITHGMPFPHNLSTAMEVESIVRAQGATPATVGVVRGRVHVGLSSEELEYLAHSDACLKVSRRDLPYAISKGLSGGTTVSGTMIAAHRAGIPVFVTGGIGGVHHGGERSMDVSADLTELGRTPIAVVSAGVKSILDVGRTLEFLETQGVCVATYGQSNNFPAFFAPQSGFTSPFHVRNPEEAAKLIEATLSLGLQSGLLIAVPISEEHAAVGLQIDDAVQTAVAEAGCKEIRGKDVTPFILQRVNELTKGKSLEASILLRAPLKGAMHPMVNTSGPQNVCIYSNVLLKDVALIRHNAEVGSQIACELSKLTRDRERKQPPSHHVMNSPESHSEIVVIGGINVDFIAKGKTEKLVFRQTNPGSVCLSFGGVGRNIADILSRLGQRVLFISAVGTDSHSHAVLDYCQHMNTNGIARLGAHSTATYCAVITKSGELSLGLGDMDIHQQLTEQYVSSFKEQLSRASLVCLDGNLPTATIDYVCARSKELVLSVWYEPTNCDKACKPFLSESWKQLAYASPNLAELCTMNTTLGLQTPDVLPSSLEDVLSCALALSRPLLEHLHCLIVTLGSDGVLVCGRHDGSGSVDLQPPAEGTTQRRLCALHYASLPVTTEIVNVSGAGDSLAGGVMAGLIQGQDTDSCVRMGLLAARFSLASQHPIDPLLCMESVDPHKTLSQTWPKPRFLWID